MTAVREQPVSYWCRAAVLPGGTAHDVTVTVRNGFIESVTPGTPWTGTVLDGLVLPGMANNHSHAFHRALRGRTHRDRGSFWTWRESMYALAARLDPERYYRLARAVYGEMVAAGFTAVGEFHYLHHAPDGARYGDPNEMSRALLAAAADAGIRITLLDTCYLSSGFGAPCEGTQRRFSDDTVDGWAARVDALGAPGEGARLGAAVHSVRAVPEDAIRRVARWATGRDAPLHVHLSEQRKENADCWYHCGRTPAGVLADAGALGERTVAVHATHLTDVDIALLGDSRTTACFCPTTERDLGDGIGPASALTAHGVRLNLGSDSHAVVDPFEEMRGLEMNERLAHERRGHFSVPELLAAATDHTALGWDDAGAIAPGNRADLVLLDTATPRTAGAPDDGAVLAATAADVRTVVVGGREVVGGGEHRTLGDIGRLLDEEVSELWKSSRR